MSFQYADAPWWERVYRLAFRDFVGMCSVREDGWAQRGGIDRVVVLRSGKVIWVDEKVRAKDYPDILLERWSSVERKTPGWIQKSLACDFIAYAFVPSETCYLLPFQQLRRAWLDNGRDWIQRAESASEGDRAFTIVEAKSVRDGGAAYTTQSVAVPVDVLLNAIRITMIIRWSEQKG